LPEKLQPKSLNLIVEFFTAFFEFHKLSGTPYTRSSLKECIYGEKSGPTYLLLTLNSGLQDHWVSELRLVIASCALLSCSIWMWNHIYMELHVQ
jgi:hypothetical protein